MTVSSTLFAYVVLIQQVCVLLADNRLDTGVVELNQHKVELNNLTSISQCGHRSDVRTLSFSLDNANILSASGEEVKLWNRSEHLAFYTGILGLASLAPNQTNQGLLKISFLFILT